MSSELSHHPSSFNAYINQGWKLTTIEPRSKVPNTKGWNEKDNHIKQSDEIPPGYGCGLLHAYSGTMALDIDDVKESRSLLKSVGVDLDELLLSDDAVAIDSGKTGRAKLLYAMPKGVALPSKSFRHRLQDGSETTTLELRCATKDGKSVQDVLPPSVHPEMLRPYQWGGKGDWALLPTIPRKLLDWWKDIIAQDEVDDTTPRNDNGEINWSEIMKCLTFIDPNLDYHSWVAVGMGLHDAGVRSGDPVKAYKMFDTWSSMGHGYQGRDATSAKWKSFSSERGVTIGTVLQRAHEGGYRSPHIDVSHMFTPIKSDIAKDPFSILEAQRPKLNLDFIPRALRDRVEEVRIDMGTDPIVSVAAGLAAACGVADIRSELHMGGTWKVPPVLWVMTVGEVGEKKTPASAPFFKIFQKLKEEAIDENKSNLRKWRVKEAKHAVQNKLYLKECLTEKTDEELAALCPDDIPPKPEPFRISVGDITSQKLTRMAAHQPRGLICILDELNGWFKRVTDERSGEDRSSWVTSFECGFYEADRVADGSWNVPRYGVSFYGNVQPKIFAARFDQLKDDGLLQRFIPFIIDPDEAELRDPVDAVLSNGHVWEGVVRRIFAAPPMQYKLTQGAYAAFREFEKFTLRQKKNNYVLNTDDSLMGSFAKNDGMVGRLALVFHLIDTPTAEFVQKETMEMAINFVRYYLRPSVKYLYGEVGGINGDNYERYMGELLIHICHKSEITSTEIKARSRGQFYKMKIASNDDAKIRCIWEAMQKYEALGWVILTTETPKRCTWSINPHLKTVFAERKERIRIAKAESQDMIVTSLKRGKGSLPDDTGFKFEQFE